jgi:ornithine cyclodeaminase/alanine dehydrogenase-like protein (mu-crystallin family)
VVAFDINPQAANAFAREVEAVGLRARIVTTPRAAVDATDVVVTAGPIEPHLPRTIDADWLHRGLLGITLDYDCYWKSAAFTRADRLLTDDFDQVEHIKEYGYFVGCPQPHAELGAVAAGIAPRRQNDSEIIITMNMGVAVEDVATAKEVFELARERSIGVNLPL